MDSGSNLAYGSATPLIEALIEFEQELEANRHSLSFDLGLIMEQGRAPRYMATPPDVIPFAHAGVDGIHYGFLTDFGLEKDLSQAPIVCVSPVDWTGVWVVARHLQDFLSVVYTENSSLKRYYASGADYSGHAGQRPLQAVDERTAFVRECFRERFGILPIQDMAAYIDSLRTERKQNEVAPTLNGLGIQASSSMKRSSSIESDFLNVTEPFLWEQQGEAVRELFRSGSHEARLAFIRDAQTRHLFTHSALRAFVTGQLKLMSLSEAATYLEESYYTVIPDTMESR
ncbi:hypothetical protein G9G63_10630 [Paenibacillus sp. EKM202P]|uniref:hypothetical protein n=1 Tax=unclassified Paenibacillus TaxID=185978 RepID=UPI0013E9F0A7|nr:MULTISPECIES: hypothetical protein [unclassified Paenibacillus]KAF6564587.1 hypothetical protein G9G63_10630 [Paenibacillus sp. EKM202P]KAF6571598.1 hypothetical protein G9G64_06145 [Paenibacillus sp. EKM207P]